MILFFLVGWLVLPPSPKMNLFFFGGGGIVLKVAGVCVLFLNVMFCFFWEGFYGSTSPLSLTGLLVDGFSSTCFLGMFFFGGLDDTAKSRIAYQKRR